MNRRKKRFFYKIFMCRIYIYFSVVF